MRHLYEFSFQIICSSFIPELQHCQKCIRVLSRIKTLTVIEVNLTVQQSSDTANLSLLILSCATAAREILRKSTAVGKKWIKIRHHDGVDRPTETRVDIECVE
jgi:hypothetical protein